jgi:hypothetical protein
LKFKTYPPYLMLAVFSKSQDVTKVRFLIDRSGQAPETAIDVNPGFLGW